MRILSKRRRRVPYVAQMEAAECGVACLAMVLRHHGATVPLSELRTACQTGRDGVSAARLYKAAQRYGLLVKALRVELEGLGQLVLPAIVHWEFNHFVVLERVGKHELHILDPGTGARVLSREEFSRAFTGVALSFRPGPDFRTRQSRTRSLPRLLRVLKAFKSGLGALICTVLLLELLGLALPAANQVLIDHVLVPRREHWLWFVVIVVALCSAACLLTIALRDRVLRRLQFAADVELASAFTRRLLELPLAFFQMRSPGDLLQRVDAQRAVREVALKGVAACLDGLLLIGYAAMMLAYDLRVGGAIMLMAGLRAALVARTQSAVTRATAAELAAQGREAQVVVEGLSAPELVLAFDAEELLRDRYEERCVARLNAEVCRRVASERTVQLTSAADGFAHAAVVYLGGLEVLDDQLTLGVFAGLVSLQALFHKPVTSLIETFSMFSRAGAVLARMDDVLDEPAATPGTHMLSGVRGSLELVDVSFRYEGRPTLVCEGVNLHIQAGERVAVVGRSGQGKSTLLRLLSGMLRPSSGRVLLDGVDLASIAPESLAQHVGVVLQEPFLLNDSVRANLAFGMPEAAETQIRSAARLACIDERICALPESYDTVLGENGARLSGGEKQRLALARALLRRPRLLLLDEATSSLDLPTEARLHHNLSELGCTRVLIAHRLETVRDADRILVFEAGRIVQQGSYAELRRIPGLFSSLVTSAQRGAA